MQSSACIYSFSIKDNKIGEKTRYQMLRDCVCARLSAHTSTVISNTLLKETAHKICSKCSFPIWGWTWIPALSGCLCTECMEEDPAWEKLRGAFLREIVRWGWWWVCLQPYSQRRCLQVSCLGLTAGTSGRQQLICLITLNPEPGHPLGTLPGLPGMGKGSPSLQRGWEQGNYKQTDPVTSTQWEHWSCF